MREIKFRAWDKKTETMFADVQKGILFDDNSEYTFNDFLNNREPEAHEYIIMQFTGLKDKNGVEIYEGDIFAYQTTSEMQNFKIEYLETYAQWWGFTDKNFGLSLRDLSKDGEAIGNVFQNPELLKN